MRSKQRYKNINYIFITSEIRVYAPVLALYPFFYTISNSTDPQHLKVNEARDMVFQPTPVTVGTVVEDKVSTYLSVNESGPEREGVQWNNKIVCFFDIMISDIVVLEMRKLGDNVLRTQH
ncbi:hypothetical protein BDC45DRAFT_538513 [Circinella umbellata]|nr:hypothetical protein BDC45DRAFT_538513 [Circinella umbellata]